jgi:tRNA(Ile)-lysidine synthase|tara:strand:+ start:438 stop:1724 length:1287 start_codon:yes stop_codon:yes gene_type:complete
VESKTRTLNTIEFPPARGRGVVVGLSGGPDSAVLALLAKNYYGKVLALYVDHQQDYSNIMEEAAENICKQYSIELKKYKIDVSSKNSSETEMRERRYEIFNKEVLKQGNILLLAHHSDDSVETFFINLLRGTRVKGLASIPKERGGVFRPLIGVHKKEILEYANSLNIPYKQDPSNDNEYILRNWIRKTLIPSFEKKSSGNVSETILGVSEEIGYMVKNFHSNERYCKYFNGYAEVPLALVTGEDYESRNLLIVFLEKVKKNGVEKRNIINLISVIKTGKEKVIFDNWVASVSTGLLILINQDQWPDKLKLDINSEKTYWNNFLFKKEKEILFFNTWNFVADKEKIVGDIYIRQLRPADIIVTDYGDKKVSELFRSKGVSKSLRHVWPIFSDDEKVIWVPGVRTSRLVYVNENSRNLIKLSSKLNKRS